MDFTDAMCSGRMEEVEVAEKDKGQGRKEGKVPKDSETTNKIRI